MSAIAVPVFVLGLLTLSGTVVTLFVTPPAPRSTVPACCRRRVDAFVAHGPLTVAGAAVVTAAGVVLLLIDLAV